MQPPIEEAKDRIYAWADGFPGDQELVAILEDYGQAKYEEGYQDGQEQPRG